MLIMRILDRRVAFRKPPDVLPRRSMLRPLTLAMELLLPNSDGEALHLMRQPVDLVLLYDYA